MSAWITDRPPTEEDAGPGGIVWTTYNGETVPWSYDGVAEGTPWMPIVKPKPYVKPQRNEVRWEYYGEGKGCWVVFNKSEYGGRVLQNLKYLTQNNDKHRKAAQKIAEIYDELMP
jgi:hypothetical protein